MAPSIENPKTEQLARELAERTGESPTEAVTIAARLQGFIRATPTRDPRSADEILGYDESGLPT